jgi:hypothetical protein
MCLNLTFQFKVILYTAKNERRQFTKYSSISKSISPNIFQTIQYLSKNIFEKKWQFAEMIFAVAGRWPIFFAA